MFLEVPSKEKFDSIDKELGKSILIIINKNIQDVLQDFSTSLNSLENMLSKTDEFVIKDKYKDIKVSYEDRDFVNYVTFGNFGRSHSSVQETVLVGDNKVDMILRYKQDRIQAYVQSTIEIYDSVSNSFFIPLLNVSKDFKTEIEYLKQNVIKYKQNLKE